MYLIDSNVLIEAKNRYYAFDIAPGFWRWLEQATTNLQICSIDEVRHELLQGDDELAEWARANKSFFRAIDQGTTRHFPELTHWANSLGYKRSALAQFTRNNADFLLIAFAREHEFTLVTHERPQPDTRKRIPIPNACVAMDVKFTDTFSMLRNMGATLELRAPNSEEDALFPSNWVK